MTMREKWETMFKQLQVFKEKNNHCNVPAHRDKLGRWVERQRSQYAAKKLTPERVDALESIGFQWKLQSQARPRNKISTDTFDKSFSEMVKRVALYVEINGHGWIPQTYKRDKHLGIWCKNRRSEKKRCTLSKERECALNRVGFVWECANRGPDLK